MYQLICQSRYCRKVFERNRKTYKYCCTRCAYDEMIGKPQHPNAGKKRTKKPTLFICQYCGNPFERLVYQSSRGKFEFCSPACRNKARQLEEIPCPICGTMFKSGVIDTGGVRRKYCSAECAWKAQVGTPSTRRTSEEIRTVIKEMYPEHGTEPLVQMLGLSHTTIQQIAYNEGVKLSPDAYRERVHGAARDFMTTSNPMKRPEVVQKVVDWQKGHRDEMLERLFRGRSKLEKKNPSGLEKKLRGILNELGIEFEPSALIKPKFVVDIRIGMLIIQADGDYWHGHSRFEPLTERQEKQRKRDQAQDKYLTTCGYTVVRIWESDMSRQVVELVLKEHGVI